MRSSLTETEQAYLKMLVFLAQRVRAARRTSRRLRCQGHSSVSLAKLDAEAQELQAWNAFQAAKQRFYVPRNTRLQPAAGGGETG